MNEMYFYQERGKTVGPFTADDIKKRIREGQIRVFDLLYKDGEQNWRMALEYAALVSEFKTMTLASLKDKPWVCLQKKGSSTTEFVTTGPFSQDEIRDALQQGTIAYSDYAWKDSLAEWKRIGSLEEFNPRARHAVLPAIPEIKLESSSELLRNVVEYQRATPVNETIEMPSEATEQIHPPPIPAESKKLEENKRQHEAKAQNEIKKQKENTAKLRAQLQTPAAEPPAPMPPIPSQPEITIKVLEHKPLESKVRELDEDAPPPVPAPSAVKAKRKKMKLRFDYTLLGILAIGLIAAILLNSRFIQKSGLSKESEAGVESTSAQAPPVPPPPVKMDPLPQPEAAPEPQAQAEAAEPPAFEGKRPRDAKPVDPKIPPREATQLILAVHAGSAQPEIELRTDATADYPIYVQIIGFPGQVTEGGAYYRFARVIPEGKIKKHLPIPNLRLPQGKFIVRAEAGDLKKETKFSWGLNDPQFKGTLSRQRKNWAASLWKERLNLFILAQALEKQLQQALVPSKKFQAGKWDKLISLKRSDGAKYLMFDEWWELHNIAKEAKTGVTGTLATRAAKERERLSTFSVWK